MKLNVLGVKRIYGLSAKSGKDFDMCSLYAAVAVEAGGSKNVTIEGFGLEVAEIALDPAALPAFKAYQGKYPLVLELETDSRPYMGKIETIVMGIRAAAVAVKVA